MYFPINVLVSPLRYEVDSMDQWLPVQVDDQYDQDDIYKYTFQSSKVRSAISEFSGDVI